MIWKRIESILAIAAVSFIALVMMGSILVFIAGFYDGTPKYFRKRKVVVEASPQPDTLKPQSNVSSPPLTPPAIPAATHPTAQPPAPKAVRQAQLVRLQSQNPDGAEASRATQVAAAAAPTQPSPTQPSPTQPSKVEEIRRVLRSIEAWKTAWQAQNVDAYLAQYAETFQPANGSSRQAWQQDRRVKVAQAKDISIQISDLRVQRLDDQRWKAIFQQRYQSATYADEVTKELLLIKAGDQYLIAEERVTSK